MLSAAILVGPAPVEPVTLPQVKTYLRIDGSDLDDDLTLMMVAAREDLERLTGLRLVTQTVRVRADEPSDLDHLTVGPVRSIVAIGTAGSGADIDPLDVADFELTGADLARGITPLSSRPAAFFRRPIVVDLSVGYGSAPADVPASLRLAILAMVRGHHDDRPVDVDRLVTNLRINA